MSTEEEQKGNPFSLLVCDTDALIQIFCSSQLALLKSLKRIYGIQCLVTEAVEDELRNPRQRRADCIKQPFEKALANETIIVVDQRNIGRFTSSDRTTTYDAIQLIGQEYHAIVQRGEAYTHATAIVLRGAALSNDFKAIKALDRAGKRLPVPVLRAYDIFAFFHQRGDLAARDCDGIRKSLTQLGDTPHSAFAACKFAEGLAHYYPRLVDDTYMPTGSPTTRELGDEHRTSIKAIPSQRSITTPR